MVHDVVDWGVPRRVDELWLSGDRYRYGALFFSLALEIWRRKTQRLQLRSPAGSMVSAPGWLAGTSGRHQRHFATSRTELGLHFGIRPR